jgi:hypothetical protein
MNTKLTLRLDKDIIEQIKIYALTNQKSLSALTEDLYKKVLYDNKENISDIQTPIAKKYKGVLGKSEIDFNSMKLKYLKAKHLK